MVKHVHVRMTMPFDSDHMVLPIGFCIISGNEDRELVRTAMLQKLWSEKEWGPFDWVSEHVFSKLYARHKKTLPVIAAKLLIRELNEMSIQFDYTKQGAQQRAMARSNQKAHCKTATIENEILDYIATYDKKRDGPTKAQSNY